MGGLGSGVAQAQNAPAVNQLPQGGNVAAGSAQIDQSGNVMNIDQTTNKAIINWNEFNVGQDARVNFNQPSDDSATLNRVLSNDPSQIFGQIVSLLTANGGSWQDVTLVDGTDGLVLGNIDATGTFSATGMAGAITQLSGTQLVIGGESTLTASKGASSNPTRHDITLAVTSTGGLHGLDVRAYSMAMDLNETLTVTFADAVGQIRALAGLYVDVGLQNQSPTALVATPAPNLPPMIGRVTLGGNVTNAGGQTYRGNNVVLGNSQSGQTITLTANTGTVNIIVGEGVNAGVTGLDQLRLALGDFTEVGDGLGNLLRTANINLNQILTRAGLFRNTLSSPQGSLAGASQCRSELAIAKQQMAGTLDVELDAQRSSSVLLFGEVEVGEIDSLACAENETLREGECVAAGG